MNSSYYIHGINGPVVTVHGGRGLAMRDMVKVGDEQLIGEVVSVRGDNTVVQVYENTSGLAPGQPIVSTDAPMSVLLGPGLLTNIFDGIARPLGAIEDKSGSFIARGINIPSLDLERVWDVSILVKEGDVLSPGNIYAECDETSAIKHRCMVPPNVSGTVKSVRSNGGYKVQDTIVELADSQGKVIPLSLCQEWPIRAPRPFIDRIPINKPLITGQRIIDTLFPIGQGGCAAIPGPFGAGKTMTQHQLAKWANANIIIYIGCGERGNEMTQVLEEFVDLVDPVTNQPLMNRTVLIANTSNMPVSAREASIYTGMTIAEYYRDMGYHVAVMADSTSRWAEALREISGRLEEMPAEEGFPAYLPSRLAEFYERAGYVNTLSGSEGSISVIGAISPQGGDFSEPVTQNTKRFIRCFWALDRALAYARHFPSINWNTSYSEYFGDLAPWYEQNYGKEFIDLRQELMSMLHEESNLMDIVKLIGSDILPEDQKLVIEVSKVIRSMFLQQNFFNEVDTYVPIDKQLKMMEIISHLAKASRSVIEKRLPLSLFKDTGIFDVITRMKYDIPNDKLELFDDYHRQIDEAANQVMSANV